uniref:Migration and invasion inhibitory protein n=1 Tax=Oryctolagus cuniculus TaxID=9986 RepID=G1SJW4_RABIT
MVETEELARLRRLSLQLLRQLWAGRDAVRHLVAQAASESSLDPSSSYNSKVSLSPETSSSSSRACSPPDVQQADPSDVASLGRVSSRVTSLPPARRQHQASLGQPRARSAPLLPITDSRDPEPSAGQGDLGSQEAQAPRPVLAQPSKSTVTCEDSEVPESSWRLRPYLGYDWIAGSLDSSSPVTSKPEAFFATLQKFREANKKECTASHSEPGFLGLHENDGVDGDHECVYCYRVNRRLFLVPSDPGTPCRLCGTLREQQGPETLLEPAQVRVSVPLSILDPPHWYRIRRRKSFDASDTLSLPRHCLLGWDILPPRSEKGSAPKSLDLWSSVFATAQHRKLSAASPSRLPVENASSLPNLGRADRLQRPGFPLWHGLASSSMQLVARRRGAAETGAFICFEPAGRGRSPGEWSGNLTSFSPEQQSNCSAPGRQCPLWIPRPARPPHLRWESLGRFPVSCFRGVAVMSRGSQLAFRPPCGFQGVFLGTLA